ncbi:MAG: DUF721 domain-containing protein [Planctomycetota bacterium]
MAKARRSKPEGEPRVRRIGSLVDQVLARRGYVDGMANEQIQQSLVKELGTVLASECQIGKLNRGTLQIFVGDSVVMQELNFRKRQILRRLERDLPESRINDVRFRVQSS